jgi:hypothetical protein
VLAGFLSLFGDFSMHLENHSLLTVMDAANSDNPSIRLAALEVLKNVSAADVIRDQAEREARDMRRDFCRIVLTWEDVGVKEWTPQQCEDFLARHENAIREAMLSAGAEEIASLLESEAK